MIPIGAIIGGLIVAARLAARDGHRPARSARGAWMVFLSVIVAPLWLLFAASLVFSDIHGGAARTLLAILLALLPLLLPWALARRLLVPLGLPRAAYWLARTPDWAWMRDPRGGAALAAAWALLRRRTFDPQLASWVEGRLTGGRGAGGPPLRGAGVVAVGMVAAARGDLDGARALLRSVRELDPMANPAAARTIAVDWLVADAASRGAWDEVAREGRETDAGRTARLMALIADRLLGRPEAAPAWRLWLCWALCSHRFAVLPLMRHALEASGDADQSAEGAASRRQTTGSVPTEASAQGESPTRWQRALDRHAAMLRRPAATSTAGDIAELGRSWDDALADRAAQRRLDERALVIGAARADEVRSAFRRQLETDLAGIARDAGVPLDALKAAGGVAAAAANALREELLAELELAGTALRARVDEKRDNAPIDEWREFLALRSAYTRAVEIGGAELQRLAFSRLKTDVWSHAYRLSSQRGENTLAHTMYAWLLGQAQAVGDSRAVEPLTGNVEATAATDPMASR